MTSPVPIQSSVQAGLRNLLLSIVPALGSDGKPVEVIQGQDNRVPEPAGTDYVVMTPILRTRLETDWVVYTDVKFFGSITGTTLTVSAVDFGIVPVDGPLWGVGVAAGARITGAGTGSGGVGTYAVGPSQSLSAQVLAAGQAILTAPTDVVYQLDFHSANVTDSADMAQAVATIFRSEYAIQSFIDAGVRATPLYADDPRQVPFINAEQQYETRWTVDVHLQVNAAVPWPQQFMDEARVTFVDVI